MDVRSYNRQAWNRQVAEGNPWTVPVTSEQIRRARQGDWQVVLTPTKPVPRAWFGDLDGARVLGLASGGGQQGPILAAAGARVTIVDNAPAQLRHDREVAEREGLAIDVVEGDMRDLSAFEEGAFDLVFHPVANCFVPDVRPVWRDVFRVLRPGGAVLAGMCNPVMFIFDDKANAERSALIVRHTIPYSDLTSISEEELDEYREMGAPMSFGHSLEDLIGGQLDAGLVMTRFYEDTWREEDEQPLNRYISTFLATRSVKARAVTGTHPTART
ncbi:MAG: class I SAM-dependent methyltransferase [Myxococcota bacterium]